MIPDNIVYTDGRDVTITDTAFKVKKHTYKLNGITKHGMYILKPRKMPAILLIVLGLILAMIGFLTMLPEYNAPAIETASGYIGANTVILWIGITLVIVGVVVLAILRKRYAVRIDTAEGEKNAVVSTKKAYISQIVDALNQAIFRLASRSAQTNASAAYQEKGTQRTVVKETQTARPEEERQRKTDPVIYKKEKNTVESEVRGRRTTNEDL